MRASAHVGTELDWLPRQDALERHGVYFELTTLDVLIYERFKNPRVVRIGDVVSSTLGYRVAF